MPRVVPTSLLALGALGCWLAPLSAATAPRPLEFNRDIRPILSDKCFGCHGPDSGHRKAGLRLDIREEAMKAPKSGDIPLKPGDPEGSHLLSRVLSSDPDEVMPPPEAKLPKLTAAEIAKLRRWIAEGAEYQPHWSFIPVKRPEVPPPSQNNALARNELDRLIFTRLAKRGFAPRPEARRETLLRRVTLDLTGLPPTASEARAFFADTEPGAYERLVDRLLASTAYGERMATDWLDVARYADSYGFQVDRDREVWPWRDWVIGAFNRNLPFNDFVTWQLGGDLLPQPTEEQILATAFNRLHQQEAEGGSVDEEYRVEYVCDRVQTFGTAFLGLTLECSKCHDHKFDPVTQKEFFQLFAFFNNQDESGLYSFFSPGDAPTPATKIIPDNVKTRLAELEQSAQSAHAHLQKVRASQTDAFARWLTQREPSLSIPGEIARFAFDESGTVKKLANEIDPKKPASLSGENKLVPGVSGQAVEFGGDDPLDLPVGAFDRVHPFSVSLWIQTPDAKERAVIFHRSKAWSDAASRGFELLLEEGRLKWSLIRFWPGDAASIRAKVPVTPGEWMHVVVTSDGSGQAAGLRILLNGKLLEVDVIQDSLSRDIGPVGKDVITLGQRMRDRGFKGGRVDDLRVFSRELTPLEVLACYEPSKALEIWRKEAESLTAPERTLLQDYFLGGCSEEVSKALADLQSARAEWVKLLNSQREIMVMRETAQPKKAYVLFRGQYDQRRDEVFAGTPAFLNPFPEGAPKNRLGLARWLTDPRNPLLARVTVNRFWQSLFGRGLTRTAEDFGSQGEQPEYPEVLDWLASQFMEGGWDVKALLRTIVLSHTYRQDTAADPKLLADDPENIHLARGPRFRLPAEMIRDSFLQASGLLVSRLGGPPVTPYEMSEAFRPANPDNGGGALRRSLYTRWRRTSPPPAMMAFDASRRAVCSARRERTNTPLQSLVLLNGPQYVEAARVLGQRLHVEHSGNLEAMIEDAFLLCLSRLPDAREREIVSALYREQLEYFERNPKEAAQLLRVGQAPAEKGVPPAHAAAAAVLAQTLLNHDGSVVKQ